MKFPKRLFLNKPFSVRIYPLVMRVKSHTMLNYESLYQNYELINDLKENNTEGAVVECGSWKGGNGAFMAKVSNRETWLFDSFEGLPEQGELDRKKEGRRSLKKGELAVPEELTHEIIKKIGVEKNTHVRKEIGRAHV